MKNVSNLLGALVGLAAMLCVPEAVAQTVWTSPEGAISLTIPSDWDFGPITSPSATTGDISIVMGAATKPGAAQPVHCTVGRETQPTLAAFTAEANVDTGEMNRRLGGRMRNMSAQTVDGVRILDYDVATPLPEPGVERVQIVRRVGTVFGGVGYIFGVTCSGGRYPNAEPPREVVLAFLRTLHIND
ncbi:MAG: hypothetical protein WDM79_13895 [Terricaulis sp.]